MTPEPVMNSQSVITPMYLRNLDLSPAEHRGVTEAVYTPIPSDGELMSDYQGSQDFVLPTVILPTVPSEIPSAIPPVFGGPTTSTGNHYGEVPLSLDPPFIPERFCGVTGNQLIYHGTAKLRDGRPALLIDPGSVENICGDAWAKNIAIEAKHSGRHPEYVKRMQGMTVNGVGQGSQQCQYDVSLPLGLKSSFGESTEATMTSATVSKSEIPGLLGLRALERSRVVLDLRTGELHMCGPGDKDLREALPEGTVTYQLEKSVSGHLMLPCCEYASPQDPQCSEQQRQLVLAAVQAEPPVPAHIPGEWPRNQADPVE